jgi:hypothetical protein
MNNETEYGEMGSGESSSSSSSTVDDLLLQVQRQHEQQDEERRRRQIIISTMDMIPIDNMNFNDGCILLNLLYSIWLQVKHPDNFRDFWNFFIEVCETNSNGRIIELYFCSGDACSFDLPPTIECLQKLEHIILGNCKSIPKELENLKNLTQITCTPACPSILFEENIPKEMELSAIKTIDLGVRQFLSSSMLSLITNRLKNIETLIINFLSYRDPNPIMHALKQNCCFRHSLKHLIISSSTFSEEEFGTFFFDILSDFSELRELKVAYCGIKSLTGIENRILLYGSTAIPQNNLRVLDLRVINPVASKIEENDPKEKSALLTILNTFTGISRVGGIVSFPLDVEYLLRINHAGRKYISGIRYGKKYAISVTGNRSANKKDSSPIIKPQLWPTILERSYQQSDQIGRGGVYNKCATGMFYLINHEGSPILQHIISMHQNKQQEQTSGKRCC